MAMRTFVIAAGLVAAIGAGVFGYESLASSGVSGISKFDQRMAPKVRSIAGEWALHDLTWEEFDGLWRVSTTFVPSRISAFKAAHHEALNSFCGAVLTALPEKPFADIERRDVYRVDLNMVTSNQSTGETQRLFPTHMPVPVRDGACLVPDKDKFTLFPTYPGALTGWELEKVFLHRGTKGDFAELVFFWTDPGEASPDGFAYLQACKAAMADPFVLNVFDQITEAKPEYSLAAAKKVKVAAKHRYGSRYLNVAKGGHLFLDLKNGTCAYAEESEDA